MQDNKWDDQFEDKAWEEMRKLLDQEMPVKERRRGLIWFFLLAGLLVAGGALGYSLYYPKEIKGSSLPETIPFNATMPVAEQHEEPDELNVAETTTSLAQNKHSDRTEHGTGQEITQNLPATSATIASINSPSIKNQQPSIGLIGKQKEAVGGQGDLMEVITKVNPLPEVSTALELAPVDVLAPIAILDYVDLEESTDSKSPLPAFQKTKQKRGFFHRMGIEFGGIVNQHGFVDGQSLGLIKELPLKKSRWALRIGAAIRENTVSGVLLIDQGYSFDFANVEAYNVIDLGNSFSLEADPEAIPTSYRVQLAGSESLRLLYLDVPLGLSYALSRKLRLESGVKGSYLLAASRQPVLGYHRAAGFFSANATDDLAIQRDQEVDFSLSNASSESYAAGGAVTYRRFDLALSAGLGYYPSRKFGFRMHYDHGFIALNNVGIQNNWNRNLHFSMTYLLK